VEGKGKRLDGVILRNKGSSDITVTGIGLQWTGGGSDAGDQRIKKITDTTTDVRLYDGEANTPFGLATAGFTVPASASTSAGCTDNDDCEWKNIAGVRYVLNTLFNIKYQIQSREYARSAPIVKHPWLYQGSFEYPSYFGHFRRYDVTMTAEDKVADWDTADAGIANANNNNSDGRKVYTAELSGGTWSPIPFDETKVSDLDDLLAVTPGGDTNDELAVITRVRGKYWNSDNSQWVERANKLGGIMHSAPAIVDHNSRTGSRDEVAYVGDLYGMLHAIETASGNEKWAFIPRNLLGKLKNDRTDPNAAQNFAAVDGSPTVKDVFYDHDGDQGTADQWRTILVSTEGWGGNYVFALDVTDPDNWTVLWELTVEAILSYTGTDGFSPGDTVTGQTSGATGEVVADDTEKGELSLKSIVGTFQNGEIVFEDRDDDGTLDPNEDNVTVTQKVEMGHAYRASLNRVKWPVKDGQGNITGYQLKWVVYVATGFLNIAEDHGGINVFAFDLATGDKLWHFSDQYVDAVNDIPGAVTLFDTTGDQFVDRVYVGDMNGRLWELDAVDGTNPHGTEDVGGVTKQIPLWNAGVGKPISVSPAIIRDSGHVVLVFGTGGADWAADDQAYSVYAVDATELKVTPTYAEGAGTLLWEQTLDVGEKVRSTPTIAAGRIYVATASGTMESSDPGEDVAGSGYLYSLDLKTGGKAWTADDNPEGRIDVGKGLSSVYVDRRHVHLTTINNQIRQIGDDDFTAGQANNVLLKAWRER
jgi:Tfp pilus tip-associated adhesin PilY1